MSTAESQANRIVHDHQRVARRSVPVGAPQEAKSEIQLITNRAGAIQAIEIVCACGERHRVVCEYAEDQP